jgi:methyl-accepting chemotaxis protein WspA
MHNLDITTKVTLAACALVLFMLTLGSALLITYEIETVEGYNREYRDSISATLEKREKEEKTALRETVNFNADILAGSVAIHLYNYDEEEMRKALRAFLNYPEAQAVLVLGDNEQPFAAAWKQNGSAQSGKALPALDALSAQWLVAIPLRRNDMKLGRLQVYYSEAPLVKKIENLKQQALANTEQFYAESQARLQQAIYRQILGIGLITLVLIILLLFLLRHLVHKPLLLLSSVAEQLSQLNLAQRLPPRQADEVGRLFATLALMIQRFREVLENAQHTSIQVNSSASELSATSRQQEAILNSQLETTRNVGQAVAEISRNSRELAKSMQNANASAHEAADFAAQGRNSLARMEQAINTMGNASKQVSERLQVIHEKAENITQVVFTITKVAEQTNLLSLNAAIEAEKAGEYGRGFTVVAREIRRLADQTAVATLDIELMVKDMQTAVSSGVMEIDKFVHEFDRSATDVEQTSGHLSRIIETVQTLTPNFERIEQAVQEQSGYTEQIDHALEELSEDMKQTTESVNDSFSAIRQLNEAALNLREVLTQFKVG